MRLAPRGSCAITGLIAVLGLVACPPTHASDGGPVCPATCPAGLACANGRCAPITCTSSSSCTAPQSCIGGFCADQSCSPPCTAGQACLDELCISKTPGSCISAVNCPNGDSCLDGFCSQPGCTPPCPGGQVCLDDICIPPSGTSGCAAPYTSCGQGTYCANLAFDSSNCGACGQACAAGTFCNGAGVCSATCLGSEALCSGRCVDTLADENNCGKCGARCPAGQACSNGACAATCAAPYSTCGSGTSAYCADEANDPVNCGGCGLTCAAGASCVGGACGVPCPAPFVTCAGVCTDTTWDPGNCGGCGAACPAGGWCVKGSCAGSSSGGSSSSSSGSGSSGSSSGLVVSSATSATAGGSSSGSACGSCLTVSPASIDFGVTAQGPPPTSAWCASLPKSVTLTNTCPGAVTVSTLTASSSFALSDAPLPPFTLVGGSAPTTFQVTFEPTAAGAQAGTLTATLAGCPGTYTTTLTADATAGVAQNTDDFTVTLVPTPVDVLWVLDVDDCGAGDIYSTIANSVIPSVFAQGAADNIDFNMALTDDYPPEGGNFEPCATCGNTVNVDGSLTTVFNASSPDAMSNLIGLFKHNEASGTPDEQMWDAFYKALQPVMLTGPNSGWRRPGAYLSIINFEDDAEDDHSTILGSCSGLDAPIDPGAVQAYYNFLVGVTGNPALVSYSYASDGAAPGASCAGQLVALSGGVQANMETPGWEDAIISFWSNIAATGEATFPLTEQPNGQIAVTVNGVAVCQCGAAPCGAQTPSTVPTCGASAVWTYATATNSIVFGAAQAPGDVISVSYPAACP